MDQPPKTKPFSIAIIGGGITGLVFATSLLKHNVPFVIYESASQFGEIGAGVGFEPTTVETMRLIDPRMKEGFLQCNKGNKTTPAAKEPPKWFTVRVGDKQMSSDGGGVYRSDGQKIALGEPLFDIPARSGPRGGVHRAHFLDQLVKLVPQEYVRFSKRLIDITKVGNGSSDAVLHFLDGSSAQHTAVVGCDGIKSQVRHLILEESVAKPRYSGKYAYRALIPMGKAIDLTGKYATETSQMYIGRSGHVLTFPIANGAILNVVAFSSSAKWESEKWVVPATREKMQSDYATWIPEVQSIIANLENPDVWALFDLPPSPTYFKAQPRICLLGDAAHATTPHQGSGAGMCVEDCFILGELLGDTDCAADIEKVFSAYESVRLERTTKLVETSREAGKLWECEGPKGSDLVL
ncbi:Protoporphyrinogen oxidase [Elsinoe australis]|uniref:Protoporphyrinogen oxidase n=1 Tax=Elsinoe australis TaxID=40998 RepID=A0A2P8AFW9_9PEZI|nr:Protoporphyrinogen oxidase [Elsinoe australis]